MDNASTRAQLLEHFLSFFLPEGILDFFELVWAESQSLDSRESKKDIIWLTPEGCQICRSPCSGYAGSSDSFPRNFAGEPYLGLAILPDFIVVITNNEYIIVDEKSVEEKAALPVAETGRIIGVQNEGFLCVKDNRLRLINITGQVIGERELTAEEIAELGK